MILSEAVIIAVASAIEAIAMLAAEAMDGQSPEQKRQLWQWYLDDVFRLRKLLGFPDSPPS